MSPFIITLIKTSFCASRLGVHARALAIRTVHARCLCSSLKSKDKFKTSRRRAPAACCACAVCCCWPAGLTQETRYDETHIQPVRAYAHSRGRQLATHLRFSRKPRAHWPHTPRRRGARTPTRRARFCRLTAPSPQRASYVSIDLSGDAHHFKVVNVYLYGECVVETRVARWCGTRLSLV